MNKIADEIVKPFVVIIENNNITIVTPKVIDGNIKDNPFSVDRTSFIKKINANLPITKNIDTIKSSLK